MASIQKKNNKYCVVYYCKDTDGKRKQKWETYDTKNAAKIRKAEIELKEKKGGIIVSNCKTLEDLINEYVELYGKDRWALSTYDGNMSHSAGMKIYSDASVSDFFKGIRSRLERKCQKRVRIYQCNP